MANISSINGNPIYLPEVDYLSRYHQHSSPFGLSLFDGESFVYNGSSTPVSVGERASYYADWFDQITAGSGTRAVAARLSDIENYPAVAKNESFDVCLYVEVADESVSETLSVRLNTSNSLSGGSSAQATVSVQKSGVYSVTLVEQFGLSKLEKYRYLIVSHAGGNALNVSKVALLREATLGNFLPDGSIGSRQIADGSIGDDKLEQSGGILSLVDSLAEQVGAIQAQTPTWDASAGCYDNASVRAWLSTVRDGREYGVRIPLTASTTLTKLGANAGMAVPTLSVGSVAGIDPYRGVGPFFYEEANGYVDPDGTPHVTAIRGSTGFSRTDADVFVLAPVLYVKYVTNADTMEIWVSDTWHPGYELQPHATLPDGTARPYMLYAKYPLGYVESGGSGAGHAASRSGLQLWTNSATNASGAVSTAVSHDGLISIMATATTGYSGRSVADDWYLKVMFWLKYATKNSQAYFPQCSGYSLSYPVTVAESNASRVIISKENAANLVVGSSVLVGTDQNAPQDHRIKSIGTYDSENSAVYLDGATVSPTTGMRVFTKPWFSGCCDAVEGDGVLGSGGKYPCVLQGIEFGHGMKEIVGDVIVSSDGGTGWHPYVCHDSAKEARSVTSDYVRCAKTLPSDSAEGLRYALAPDATDEGLIFGSTSGGGTSTGLCDGSFSSKESAAGTREWQALGALDAGANAGLCFVDAGVGLGGAWWSIGSRLSATGRSRG